MPFSKNEKQLDFSSHLPGGPQDCDSELLADMLAGRMEHFVGGSEG